MTLRLRGRLTRASLIATMSLAAMLTGFGLSVAPASAANVVTNGCLNSGYVCFYTDINFQPLNAVLNLTSNAHVWTVYPNTAGVCQGDWNDCASSVSSHTTSGALYAWRDEGCQNGVLGITHGQTISDLGPYGYNDVISADKVNNSTPGC
jgi:Peptidase inhibitor family I36